MTPASSPEPDAVPEGPPLRGLRIVVCRTSEQAAGLLASISELGGVGLALPLLELAPPRDGGAALDAALADLASYNWLILTSSNAVHAVAARRPRLPASLRVAVVGPATARATIAAGWQPAFEATTATAEALATALPFDDAIPPRVLAPLAELAADTIERVLHERGATVDRVDAYCMETPEHPPERVAAALAADVVLLTSPSTADRFAALATSIAVGNQRSLPSAVVIGPSTETAAIAAGFGVIATADPHTEDGLLAALVRSIGR